MRRAWFALALLIAVVSIVLPTRAFAAFHLVKVNEVVLSDGGDPNVQYIELLDPGEPFPPASGPYTLQIFDVDGMNIGTVAMDIPAGSTRMLVSTAAADAFYGVTGDYVLTVALPTNGQACFMHAGSPVNCLGWGCVTTRRRGRRPGRRSPHRSHRACPSGTRRARRSRRDYLTSR